MDGIITFAKESLLISSLNPGVEAMFGYQAAHLLGRPIALLFGTDEVGSERAKLARIAAKIVHLAALGDYRETIGKRADASTFLMEVMIAEAGAGQDAFYIGVFRETIERERPEQDLRHLITSARCLLWYGFVEAVDLQKDLFHWELRVTNEDAAQQILPLEVPPGQTYTVAWHHSKFPEDRQRMDETFAATLRAGKLRYTQEFRCRGSDGQVRWLFEDARIEPMTANSWKIIGVCTDITERKQAEMALQEGEERYRLLLEASPDVIIMYDAADCVTYVNPAFTQTFGWTPEEVVGRPLKFTPPEKRAQIRQIIERVFREGKVPAFETQLLTKSGQKLDVSVSGAIFHNRDGNHLGGFAIMRDISEHKRADQETAEARRQAEARAEQLATLNRTTATISSLLELDEMLEAICREMVQIFKAHNAGVALLDPDRTQLTAVAVYNRDPDVPRAVGRVIPLRENLSSLQVVESGKSLVVPDAQTSPLTKPIHDMLRQRNTHCLAIIPLRARGEVIGTIAVGTAEVDRVFTPAEVELAETIASQVANAVEKARLYSAAQQAKEAAEEARKAAEEANRAKSAFLANMSHELRTPLNAILGFTQLMSRDQTLSPEQRDNLEVISRSGEHLLALINDVLEMSKIEAGRTTLNPQSFDLYRLLDGLKDLFLLRTTDKGLQLNLHCAPNLPQYVHTDEGKLRQVLINLLGNAVKFTEEGGVTLRVRSEPAEPEVSRREKGEASTPSPPSSHTPTLYFEVEDTGPGIAPHELETLFDAFAQTTSGQKSQEGTGLGLAISRQFVRLMGGEITVSSIVGQGSIFTFHLPIELAEVAEVERGQPGRPVVALAPGQPAYRLLVVEDNWANRRLLVKMLEPLGFAVREAKNGREAVAIAAEWEPHLIWMDMRMPVMDGYEATKQIKAAPKGQAMIVVALTASAFEEERALILSTGCDDFVRKPYQEHHIFDKLAKHLGVRYLYEDLARPESDGAGEQQGQPGAKITLTAEALAILPAEWLASLYQAATQADAEPILDLLDQIDAGHRPLAEALADLVYNFRFDTIMSLAGRARHNASGKE